MAWKTHLFNTGALLVGTATGDLIKDRLSFKVGPLTIDGRLLIGVGSIALGEFVPQFRANATLKSALDLIGAVNLANWMYDQIYAMVGGTTAPTPAPTQAPQTAQAGMPAVVVATAPAEASVGRIV